LKSGPEYIRIVEDRLQGGDQVMKASRIDELYDEVRRLSANERLRLVEKIIRELAADGESPEERPDWSALAGAAPDLLQGEDAQEWVSRSRRTADQDRQTGRAKPLECD
jgi:hypothetical protein